jgi:hypothetical protein
MLKQLITISTTWKIVKYSFKILKFNPADDNPLLPEKQTGVLTL